MYSKKLLLAAIFICLSNFIKAQSYSGFLTDNYNGVHGIISNPANIADSRLKLDVNLVGISAFFGNDYIGFKLKDALSGDYEKVFDEAKTFPSTNNSLAWNVDVLGPSAMFTINEKSSVALFTRARGFFNLNDVDGTLIEKEGDFDEDEDFSVDEGVISGAANLWAEIGVTYAQVLMNKDEHFIKGGVSLKYLQSAGHAYLYANGLTVDYVAATRFVNTTGELVYGNSESFNDQGSFELGNGRGFGADLGLVYEWRPDHANYTKLDRAGNKIPDRGKNKYKLKFGLSTTDLGQIKNKNSVEDTYNLNADQDIDNFDGDDLEDALQENFVLVQSTSSQNSILPTALHTNADWNMGSNFYLNLNMDMPLTARNKINTNRVLSEFALTPRYESTWLSFHSPLRLVQYAGVQWGAGLRAGPIYMGSGSIMSVLLGSASKSFDLYAGLKLPFYQSRLRDKDNDGIENNSDNCPEVPGPVENNGCPWPDTDGDGILDKDDDCPNEAGLAEHNGCPDSDGDGLIDKNDRCPNKVGKIEDKGCPDTDEDTLVDIDDLCPNKPGPVENNGCPVVTVEVQKQLNTYARTILFDTGKATIKTESVSTMVDIIQILKEYPNAKFTVEGHTDSVGSASSNQKLSEARANSIKDFLIKEGIAADRLNAIGFGEEKPIASNATRSGRKENRRVEINLIK